MSYSKGISSTRDEIVNQRVLVDSQIRHRAAVYGLKK